MYGKETPSTSYKNAVLNEIESDALKELNTWYESHLTNYEKYLEKDAIFCNDRRSVDNFADTWEVWLSNSHEKQYNERNTGGYGKTGTSFGPRMRIFGNNWLNIQAADLSCQLNDSFTPTDAAKGNKAMKHPIGLITLDEVLMGGGFGGRYNDSYYLYTGQFYWTMSPADYYTGGENRAGIYHVGGAEGNYHYTTDVGVQSDNHGIRPVINLKASTTFSTGDGSKEKPFEVS